MLLSTEEIGLVVFRLALADEDFLCYLVNAIKKAGPRMLPDDSDCMESWAQFVREMREALNRIFAKSITAS